MKRLFALYLFIFTFQVQAGISNFYFEQSGISCATNGVRLSDSIIGSPNELSTCFTGQSIVKDELHELEKNTKDIQLDLETWIYIQSATRKIIENSKVRLNQLTYVREELTKGNEPKLYRKLNETFTLLRTLYLQKSKLEDESAVCSNWRFWNYAERIKSSFDCDFIKSNQFKEELANIDQAIEKLEAVNPTFIHPTFQASLSGNNTDYSFSKTMNNFLNSAIPNLESKQERFQKLTKTPLSKKNINSILNSPKTLSEIVAVNYKPEVKITNNNQRSKVLSLNIGKCHLHQTLTGHKMDDLLKDFGTDVALLISPFAIKGKITTIFKAAKMSKNLLRLKQARGAIVLAEGSYIAIESSKLKNAENKCDQINREISHHITTPKNLVKEARECKELMQSISTSYALAVLGGSAAIKLSKVDLTDIRISRFINRGKTKLYQSASVVKTSLIKQADLITNQMNDLTEQLTGSPQLAVIGGVTPPISTTPNIQTAVPTQSSSIKASDSIDKKVLLAINKIDCQENTQCMERLAELTPGLQNLARQPKGIEAVENIFKLINDVNLKKLNKNEYAALKNCLEIKNNKMGCNPKQIKGLIMVLDLPLENKPHPYFLTQVTNYLKYDASNSTFAKFTNFMSSYKNTKNTTGSIDGIMNSVKEVKGKYIINGKTFPKMSRASMDAEGKYKENLAVKALSKMGFNIKILHEDIEVRKKEGMQKLFQKLATSEKLGAKKSPDIIINGKHLADVYSPFRGITTKNISIITAGILKKSEGKNFKFTVSKWDKKTKTNIPVVKTGTRQTNRVVVYAGKKPKHLQQIISKLRDSLGNQKPQHLEEAFIIIENDGTPKMIRIWP
jgi:hypothetical protein